MSFIWDLWGQGHGMLFDNLELDPGPGIMGSSHGKKVPPTLCALETMHCKEPPAP